MYLLLTFAYLSIDQYIPKNDETVIFYKAYVAPIIQTNHKENLEFNWVHNPLSSKNTYTLGSQAP